MAHTTSNSVSSRPRAQASFSPPSKTSATPQLKKARDAFTRSASKARLSDPLAPLAPKPPSGLPPSSPRRRPAAAEAAPLQPIDASTIEYLRDADTNEIEFKYRDQHDKLVGPYIISITPHPEDDVIAHIKGALVNLIDMARTECPSFESVSFTGGLETGQPASARILKATQQGQPPQWIVLGGNNAQPGLSNSKADFIGRQLEVLKEFLVKSDFKIKIKARRHPHKRTHA
jgi:hypothetical protein